MWNSLLESVPGAYYAEYGQYSGKDESVQPSEKYLTFKNMALNRTSYALVLF